MQQQQWMLLLLLLLLLLCQPAPARWLHGSDCRLLKLCPEKPIVRRWYEQHSSRVLAERASCHHRQNYAATPWLRVQSNISHT
jgi:hypothetical protein